MDLAEDTLSTVIDTDRGPSASGGGAPDFTPPAEPSAPASLREDLEATFKEDADKQPEPAKEKEAEPAKEDKQPEKREPRPEKVEKVDALEAKDDKETGEKPSPQRDDGGKFARRDDQREQRTDAPATFLPKAKELWRNTPLAVQSEVSRLVTDFETKTAEYRERAERYDVFRDFDETARSNGRDLRQSLEKVVEVEQALQRNPIAGLNAILMEIGPRKPDGQPFSLFEVAQHIVQSGPQGYQQMVAQQPAPEQPKEDPRVAQLEQQLQQMQHNNLQLQVIEPFKRDHPRYDELQGDIAFFLQSGKIPTSLSPIDRLAAAYDMAERINPPSHASVAREEQGLAEPPRRADEDFSGSRSIKSSPGSVTETFEPEAKSGESIRDSILRASRSLTRA